MERAPSRYQKGAFGVLFAIAAFFFLWTVSPIWVPVFLGVLLAVVATPLQTRLERRFGGHPRLLAAAITAVTLAIGVGVLVVAGIIVVREVLHFITDLMPGVAQTSLGWLHSPTVAHALERLGATPESVARQVSGHATVLAEHLTALLGSLLSVTSNGIITLVFTAITSYYLLLEGRALSSFLVRLLPLPPDETRALMSEFHRAAVSTVLGVGVVSLAQGLLATVGFALFHVPRPLVWGALTAIASLVPIVGTGLVYVPVVVYLLFTHHIGAGIVNLGWWVVLVIGLCDYVLRPRLMEGRMRLHSLLVLIAIFGGLEAFGPLGIVLGPLSVALFVAILRIYERNYRPSGPPSLQPQNP